MCLSRSRWATLPLVLLLAAPAASAAAQTAFGTLSFVENEVEARGPEGWKRAVEESGFDIGQLLRTGPDGMARLQLPWMAVTVSPDSVVRLPDEFILSIALDDGRAVLESAEREALKLVTPEGEVRGIGRAVVRRAAGRTVVSCLSGRFQVEAGGRGVTLEAGRGTIVTAGRGPSPAEETPAPPLAEGLWPGADPVYAERGEAVDLEWQADADTFHIEVLPVGRDYVLLQRDVGRPPVQVRLPWGGAFRWRVASLDDRGLEGVPSAEGLICIDLVE